MSPEKKIMCLTALCFLLLAAFLFGGFLLFNISFYYSIIILCIGFGMIVIQELYIRIQHNIEEKSYHIKLQNRSFQNSIIAYLEKFLNHTEEEFKNIKEKQDSSIRIIQKNMRNVEALSYELMKLENSQKSVHISNNEFSEKYLDVIEEISQKTSDDFDTLKKELTEKIDEHNTTHHLTQLTEKIDEHNTTHHFRKLLQKINTLEKKQGTFSKKEMQEFSGKLEKNNTEIEAFKKEIKSNLKEYSDRETQILQNMLTLLENKKPQRKTAK